MSMGPGKVVTPDDSGSFGDWQDFHRDGEAAEFKYSDSTTDHILEGESQKFHYEGNDLPEKM